MTAAFISADVWPELLLPLLRLPPVGIEPYSCAESWKNFKVG